MEGSTCFCGMPKCCKCNTTGSCSTCTCAKSKTPCVNCMPGAKHRCKNSGFRLPFTKNLDIAGQPGSLLNAAGTAARSSSTPTRPAAQLRQTQSTSQKSARPSAGASTRASVSGVTGRSQPLAVACATMQLESSSGFSSSQPVCGKAHSNQIALFANCADDSSTNHATDVPCSTEVVCCATGANTSDLGDAITTAYEKVIHWRQNLFMVPYGKTGGDFVDDLAALIQSFVDSACGSLKKVAWKAVTVICHLLLQKPNPTGSTTWHSEHLERRLSLWRTGSIPELFEEAICIQNHLPIGDRKRKEKRSGLSDSVFSGLVFSGKINAAIRYVCE